MPHRVPLPDPDLPQPGERTGEGSDSLLPFLKHRRAAKPRAPNDFLHTEPESAPGGLTEGQDEDPPQR
jgi:hypothetical protein